MATAKKEGVRYRIVTPPIIDDSEQKTTNKDGDQVSESIQQNNGKSATAYSNFFFTQDVFTQNIIPRPVLQELIHEITVEIKARGVLAPYLLVSYRPESTSKDLQMFINTVFPLHRPPLTGEALLREIRLADIYSLAGVLKWCWCRIPGGVVSWKAYDRFKQEEQDLGFRGDAFLHIIPRCVESVSHATIVFDFFDLMASIATHGRKNGLGGRKLARLAGTWAFDIRPPHSKDPTSFSEGLSFWSLAAEATNHLFYAFLRALRTGPDGKPIPERLPKTLNQLVEEYVYPPELLYKSRLVAVPMITLTVGRLSANPLVLLRRVAKTISFENPADFNSEDDFNTLYFLFRDSSSIEYKISSESLRIIQEVINENPLVTDHPLHIKDTPKLSYDVRGKTWSKFYNHAYVNPGTGELSQPLTSYVYDDNQLQQILRASAPTQENTHSLPYPENDEGFKAIDWETGAAANNGFGSSRYNNTAVLEGRPNSKQRNDSYVTAVVSQIAIDDFFVWVWMSSLSEEQTEVRKATFGRSIIVETQLSPGQAGKRWVVVEEILHPEPGPIELPPVTSPDARLAKHHQKPKPVNKVSRRAVSTPVAEVKKRPEPKKHKRKSTIVHMPEPAPPPPPPKTPVENHYHHHHNNYQTLDPALIDAIAKKLNVQSSDQETQTPEVHDMNVETEFYETSDLKQGNKAEEDFVQSVVGALSDIGTAADENSKAIQTEDREEKEKKIGMGTEGLEKKKKENSMQTEHVTSDSPQFKDVGIATLNVEHRAIGTGDSEEDEEPEKPLPEKPLPDMPEHGDDQVDSRSVYYTPKDSYEFEAFDEPMSDIEVLPALTLTRNKEEASNLPPPIIGIDDHTLKSKASNVSFAPSIQSVSHPPPTPPNSNGLGTPLRIDTKRTSSGSAGDIDDKPLPLPPPPQEPIEVEKDPMDAPRKESMKVKRKPVGSAHSTPAVEQGSGFQEPTKGSEPSKEAAPLKSESIKEDEAEKSIDDKLMMPPIQRRARSRTMGDRSDDEYYRYGPNYGYGSPAYPSYRGRPMSPGPSSVRSGRDGMHGDYMSPPPLRPMGSQFLPNPRMPPGGSSRVVSGPAGYPPPPSAARRVPGMHRLADNPGSRQRLRNNLGAYESPFFGSEDRGIDWRMMGPSSPRVSEYDELPGTMKPRYPRRRQQGGYGYPPPAPPSIGGDGGGGMVMRPDRYDDGWMDDYYSEYQGVPRDPRDVRDVRDMRDPRDPYGQYYTPSVGSRRSRRRYNDYYQGMPNSARSMTGSSDYRESSPVTRTSTDGVSEDSNKMHQIKEDTPSTVNENSRPQSSGETNEVRKDEEPVIDKVDTNAPSSEVGKSLVIDRKNLPAAFAPARPPSIMSRLSELSAPSPSKSPVHINLNTAMNEKKSEPENNDESKESTESSLSSKVNAEFDKPLPLDPKWDEVKNNLAKMRENRKSLNSTGAVPVLVDRKGYGIGNEHEAERPISPDEYYDAVVHTMRRPSILTGDHVKPVLVRDDPEEVDVGKGNVVPVQRPMSMEYDRTSYYGTRSIDDLGYGHKRSWSLQNSSSSRYSGSNYSGPPSSTRNAKNRTSSKLSEVSSSGDLNYPLPKPFAFDPMNEQSLFRAGRAGLLNLDSQESPLKTTTSENNSNNNVYYHDDNHNNNHHNGGEKSRRKVNSMPVLPKAEPKSNSNAANVSRYSILGIVNAVKKNKN